MAEIGERPKSVSDTAKGIVRRLFRHENAVLGFILIGMIAVMAIATKGATTSVSNVRHIMLQSSTRGVASVGQFFVILTAGIDLSVGGLAMLSTVLGAQLMTSGWQSIMGYPLPVSAGILIMLTLGLGVGAFNGVSVSRIRIPALIVTLAVWQISKGIACQLTHGASVMDLPDGLRFFGQGSIAGVPVAIIIFISVAAVAYFVLYHTTFGRSVYAVGGNPISAWLSGINVKRVLFSVYTISGFLAGLAGVIVISRTMGGSVLNAVGLELESIASVVIGGVSLTGGRGTLIGVIIGVSIMGIIGNGMNVIGISPYLRDIVMGGIIYVAVAINQMRRR